MFLFKFINKLNIKNKLREIKNLIKDIKDKRRVKKYK